MSRPRGNIREIVEDLYYRWRTALVFIPGKPVIMEENLSWNPGNLFGDMEAVIWLMIECGKRKT